MSIVTALAHRDWLAFSGDPSTAKQEMRSNDSPVKPATHDDKRSMNEERLEAMR
jgi:hypothetical protein